VRPKSTPFPSGSLTTTEDPEIPRTQSGEILLLRPISMAPPIELGLDTRMSQLSSNGSDISSPNGSTLESPAGSEIALIPVSQEQTTAQSIERPRSAMSARKSIFIESLSTVQEDKDEIFKDNIIVAQNIEEKMVCGVPCNSRRREKELNHTLDILTGARGRDDKLNSKVKKGIRKAKLM